MSTVAAAYTQNNALNEELDELASICRNTLSIMSALNAGYISHEKIKDALSDLAVEIVHLHAHSDGLQDLINDEIGKNG
ncbi:MAG: hypothetical protein EPN22_02225 [Nitrospirae bacterium]|nr:MAG: hypothetical protein EPN22_02225 [Nitrospirota bacterium]